MRKDSLSGNKLNPKYNIPAKCQEISILDQCDVLEKNGYGQLRSGEGDV